jgi:hypothetical protein
MKLRRRPFQSYHAGFQDIASAGHIEREFDILLDEQDRRARNASCISSTTFGARPWLGSSSSKSAGRSIRVRP